METIEVCDECGYAYSSAQGDTCPNPACWPGLREYIAASVEWRRAKDRYYADVLSRNPRAAFNANAIREIFERENPAPKISDYDRRIM